jgi:predicted AAA+ superfamily ATPase
MMEEVIVRKKYLDKLIPFIGKQLIKVLTGQRRVGKSYVLKQVMIYISEIDSEANIIYINKEDLGFSGIQNAADLNGYILQKTKTGSKNYVCIDEIQEIEQFENALRSLLLSPHYDLYITGSNANLLSGELATYLSGRYIELEVLSLSYPEFLEFHVLQNTQDTMMMFLKYGGLPYLRHLELSDEIVFGYLKGIYSSIIYRDVIMRHEIRSSAFLENLVVFLANNIGQLFSAKKISDYLKSQKTNIATSQIIHYLSHLSNAFLIHKVPRYDIVGKRIFEVGDKFYFEDIGLRNAIFQYNVSDIGKIMENAVYHHLKYNDYDVKIGTVGSNEIDFVARRKGELLYVQVSYLLHDETTIAREFGNLEKIKDNYPKMVVSMDDFRGDSYKGIQHIRLKDFLSMAL